MALCLISGPAHPLPRGPETVIPPDRLADWTCTGVPGGIPERTEIFRTLRPGATAADINAVIKAASGSGKVVYLEAGTYRLSAPIDIAAAAEVTLRGAGAGKTIIDADPPGPAAIVSSPRSYIDAAPAGGADIAAGYEQGSTRITLAAAPGRAFQAGRLIQIVQDDDQVLVFHRRGNWAGGRNLRHTSRITEVKGKAVTFATPIPFSYDRTRRPQALAQPANARLVGIEALTVRANGRLAVAFGGADRCWIRGLETSGTGNSAIELRGSSQCEVRGCYLHDAHGFPRQSDGYGIFLFYGTGFARVEDNIGCRLGCLVLMNGASTNAVAYNFDCEGGRAGLGWVLPSINCNHGPHGIMNLFEGNVIARFQNDGYHGSTSHGLLLRNRIHGLRPEFTFERQLVDLCRGSYYHSLLGNVLGDASWTPGAYEMSGQPGHAASCIYQLGYPNADNTSLAPETEFEGFRAPLPDARVRETLLRHGNYDYFNRRTLWDENLASKDLPASLLYASKPGYFGSLPWPPIGPDVEGLAGPIPAQARWEAYGRSGDVADLFKDP